MLPNGEAGYMWGTLYNLVIFILYKSESFRIFLRQSFQPQESKRETCQIS